MFDVTAITSNPANQPLRWLAEGRDAVGDDRRRLAGFGKNDSDNEITGRPRLGRRPGPQGILGEKAPNRPGRTAWRWFYTQQHGDNNTYEVVPNE